MFKEISEFVRKSAAKIFTWPNRYLIERTGPTHTVAGPHITPENSMGCSAVAACVRLLSETIAALPLHVYRTQDKSKSIATDHPIYSLIHSSPNDF
jgi:phage portal protein BeeE